MNTAVQPSLLARQRMAYEMIDRGEPLRDILALLCHIVEAEAPALVRAAILLVDPTGCKLHTGAASRRARPTGGRGVMPAGRFPGTANR